MLGRVLILFLAVLWLGPMTGEARAEGIGISMVHGSDAGAPLSHRFSSSDFGSHPGNLDVLALATGEVYAGNFEGLLRYAGGRFELIALPGAVPARALAEGRDGKLYVASYDHFGVIEVDANGERSYRDLRSVFGLEGRDAFLGAVWSVHALDDGVYFHAGAAIFHYDYSGSGQRYPLPDQTRAFHDDGRRLLTRVEGEGMKLFSAGLLLAMPDGELFADRPLDLVIPLSQDEQLLVSRDGGFYRMHAGGIEPRPNPFVDLFERHVPYAAERLHDGTLAIATLTGELFVFGSDLRLQQRYRLGVYPIMALSVDIEHGLWAATQGGLVRLRLPSPWTAIAADDGLPGQVTATAWHDGRLWIAGSRGLSHTAQTALGEARVLAHESLEGEVWDLESTPAGLLAATRSGLLRVTLDGSEQLFELEEPYLLVTREEQPGRLYVAGDDQLWVVNAGGAAPELLQEIKLDGVGVASIEALSDREIWIGDYRGGPRRIRLSADGRTVEDMRQFGPEDGVDADTEFGSVAFRLDGVLHLLLGTRVLAWNGVGFAPSEADGMARLLDRPGELALAETPHGTYVLTSRTLHRRAQPGSGWEAMTIDSPLARGFQGLVFGEDGVLRLNTWNGILQYRHGTRTPPSPPLRAALRSVRLDRGEDGTAQLPLKPDAVPKLQAGSSPAFAFELLASEPKPCFRTRLLGAERHWSSCAEGGERQFLALPNGSYRFEVKAHTPSGRESDIVAWDFEVLPHWHESLAVRLTMAAGLVLLVLALSALLSRRRHHRLEVANRELEARIAERTAALEEANLRLNQLATEDSLTGVANRRALDQGLAREWLRCADRRLPLAVLMIDVDHFKTYNDRHGHLEGDRVLRRLAEHLRSRVDDQRELLARYGGEEFVLVVPDADLEAGRARAESLRRSVDGPHFPVTLSIGVASTVPQQDDAPSQLVRRADRALYSAKEKGRNRVECAD
jgi:diguanylate cyclase (GGDEF)-like protein